MSKFNGLSPEEEERLDVMQEEASEVIKAIAKIKRHGWDSYNPFDPSATSNRRLLENELGDFRNIQQMMALRNDVDMAHIVQASHWKRSTCFKYMHEQNETFMRLYESAYPVPSEPAEFLKKSGIEILEDINTFMRMTGGRPIGSLATAVEFSGTAWPQPMALERTEGYQQMITAFNPSPPDQYLHMNDPTKLRPNDGHELCGRDYKCDCTGERSCMICDGGLSFCRVCGGAEANLPSECPKVKMTEHQQELVTAQRIDFRNGEWVTLGEQPPILPKENPPEGLPEGLMEKRDNY